MKEDFDVLSVMLAPSEKIMFNKNRGEGPRKARVNRTEGKI